MNGHTAGHMPSEPSMTAPFTKAWDYMKALLFQPFQIERWLVLGLCVWMAQLFKSGGSGLNFPSGGGGGGGPMGTSNELQQAADWMATNMALLVGIIIGVTLVLIPIILLVQWLRARGEFMLRHNLANRTDLVVEPWKAVAPFANSYFLLQGTIALFWTLLFSITVIANLQLVQRLLASDLDFAGSGVLTALIVQGVVFLLLGILSAIIQFLLYNVVINVMASRRIGVWAAIGESLGLIGSNLGSFILFWLMRIAITILIGVLVMVLMLVTCCLAACLLAIPFLGTIVLLPVFIFERAYSMYAIAEFGDQYRILPEPWDVGGAPTGFSTASQYGGYQAPPPVGPPPPAQWTPPQGPPQPPPLPPQPPQ
jgi:hypothetical protein